METPFFNQTIELSGAQPCKHRRFVCRYHSRLFAAVATISNQDSPLAYGDGFFNLQVDLRLSLCFQVSPDSPRLRTNEIIRTNRTNEFVTTRVRALPGGTGLLTRDILQTT